MEFDGILVLTIGSVAIAAVIMLPRLFPRDRRNVSPTVTPVPTLTKDAVKGLIAEGLKGSESEIRMLRAEWVDVFDKFKRMEARRYARQKREEEKEEDPLPLQPGDLDPEPQTGIEVEVAATRRAMGM